MNFQKLLALFTFLIWISVHAQSTASRQVSTFTIAAPQLETEKKIWVYLPKDYQNSQKPYSVIYMHDAQNLFDEKTSYVGEWKIDEYLDSINENESIIVGIEHGNEKRIDELTPYITKKYGGGKGDLYLDFVVNSLKPKIDSIYNVYTDAKHTAIFGSSLGGLISLYAVIKYPEIFGKAGIFSPAFWLNPEIYELVNTTKINSKVKLFFLAGTDESNTMIFDQEKMVAILLEKGINKTHVVNKIIEGGKHSEAMWSTYFPEAYQWLMTND